MIKTEWVNETISNYEQFINPSVARLFRFMGLSTIEWTASGSIITDSDGKEYIDCLGGYGVFSLGHRHPVVLAAVKEQLELMPLSSKVFFSKPLADASAAIARITPGNLQYSFFGNSGAEAVEGALKLARIATGRKKVIAANNSFHGKSMGALSATGRDLFRDPFLPLLEQFFHIPFGDTAALAAVIDETTAAVILEPVQGEGGIIVPPDDYLPAVRKLCDSFGTLLICDEVQTGLGRTGAMFAVDHYQVVPDIMTVAKALGGGIMPVGAFIATEKVWQPYIESPFLHTSTFGGNPLAAVAAVAAIKVVEQEGLVEQSAEKGLAFLIKLQALAAVYPEVIREVRGKGLMIGIEFTKEGVGGFMMSNLIGQGILAAYTLNNPKVLRMEPPLIITDDQLATVMVAITTAVEQAQSMIEDL
jgi:putrescine aminotransferase